MPLKAKSFLVLAGDLPRLEQCPAAGVFRGPPESEDRRNQMWWGIFVHKFLEIAVEQGREAGLKYVRQKFQRALETCRRIDVDFLISLPEVEVEVPWARDLTTGEAKRVAPFPFLPDPSRFTYGRADLTFKGERRTVVDFKCGDATETRTPAGHLQLLGLAASAASDFGVDEVAGVICSVPSSGALVWRETVYSAEDIAEHAAREQRVHLAVMQARADYWERGTVPEFVTGPACELCECKPACPAHGHTLEVEKGKR